LIQINNIDCLTLVGHVSTLAILFPAKKYWSIYNSGVTNM